MAETVLITAATVLAGAASAVEAYPITGVGFCDFRVSCTTAHSVKFYVADADFSLVANASELLAERRSGLAATTGTGEVFQVDAGSYSHIAAVVTNDAPTSATLTVAAAEPTGTESVTFPASVPGDAVTVYAGDDYDAAHGRAITFTVADPSYYYGLDTATSISLKSRQATWTGTAVQTVDGYTVTFQPTAAETAALTVARQTYEVEAVLSDGDVVTLARGMLLSVKDI